MRFNVMDETTLELNVTGLQPDTRYSVQVAALTRKGDGDRSAPATVKTPGGVPNRPIVTLKYVAILVLFNYKPKYNKFNVLFRSTEYWNGNQ